MENINIDLKQLTENLTFEYFETYSLQRGLEFEIENLNLEKKYEKLLEKSISELVEEEKIKQKELEKKLLKVQFLFDDNMQIHYSAEKIKTFSKQDSNTRRLMHILKIETQNIPSWMCAPVYRDVIVFYNIKNEIVEILNICFSCEYIQNKSKKFVDADKRVYDELKTFLIGIGHKITEN